MAGNTSSIWGFSISWRSLRISILVGILVACIEVWVKFIPDLQPWFQGCAGHSQLGHIKSAAGFLSFAVVGVFLAPPVEEFIFRGVMYHELKRGLSTATSVLIVSILFVAVHAPYIGNFGTALLFFISAMVMTVARVMSRSLVSSIAIHVALNLSMFGFPVLSHYEYI